MDNDFYVYEWFNINTGEVFYVGKGRKNRYKSLSGRNKYFLNYNHKYNCDVRKIKKNLTEEQAFNFEIETIKKYWDIGQCKCNLSEGGEGSTFPKGSWNDLFRKLQYLYSVKDAMFGMVGSEEYEPKNLKEKSLEELDELYNNFLEFKEGVKTFNSLVYDKHGKVNEGFEHLDNKIKLDKKCMTEMRYQYEEICMLTKLVAETIANKHKEFKEFLKYKDESDFMCCSFDTDKFISLMLEDIDYLKEIIKCIFDNLCLLKVLGSSVQYNLFIKIVNFDFTDNDINIKFFTSEDKHRNKVTINLYDLIWGILAFKNKPCFQIILDEIVFAPII